MSRASRVLLFILPALIFIGHISAQNSGWGSGIIIPEKGIQPMHINMPLASFELFDTPGGEKAGAIFMKNSVNIVYSLERKMIVCRVKNEDLIEVVAAGWCLKYYEEQGDFIKILVQSTDNGMWISKTELNYLHMKPETWLNFMLAKKTGFYPNIDIGLNLRQEPDAGSKKIVLMKGDHYLIDLDGETEGAWAKATVKKYNTRPCKSISTDNLNVLETYHGWLKIVDDKGFPNIWFYTRGCK
jgi:hypothetical protein